MNKIICIGRQYGSGGRVIGEAVAKKLGISFYDKDLLDEALAKTDLPQEALRNADEKRKNPFMYSVYYQGKDKEYYGMDASSILFEMQKKIILENAKKGDCVFVGRCADFILSECKDISVLSVFIVAPMKDRIARIMEREGIDEKSASDKIRKIDKKRKAHYDYYTGKDWGKPSDYDIIINSSRWGEQGSVELIEKINL